MKCANKFSSGSFAITALLSSSRVVMAARSFHVPTFSNRYNAAASPPLSGFTNIAFQLPLRNLSLSSARQHPVNIGLKWSNKTPHQNFCIPSTQHLPIYLGSTCLFSKPDSNEYSQSSIETSSTDTKETSVSKDLQSIAAILGAQGLLIPISIGLAKFLELPNMGLGASFVLSNGAFVAGVQWTIPLFALAGMFTSYATVVSHSTHLTAFFFNPGIMKLIEPYSSALQDVTKATQRSVLAVMGPKRRPIFALLVSILLGGVAGWG